jgi:hypothetical protein
MWLLACAMDDGTIIMLTLASDAEDDAPAAFERTDTLSWQRTNTLVLQPAAAEAAMTPGSAAAVVQLAWSADGKWLIAGTADGALHAVDVPHFWLLSCSSSRQRRRSSCDLWPTLI